MMLIKKDIIGVNTQKKIRNGNKKCLKIEELGLGGNIQMVMRGRKIMRYREDRGGEKERAEENNRSQDHKEKERSEKESNKRKDIGGNEQNADQGLSDGGVHLSAMELEVLKAKEERLAKKTIAADVCDDILAWVRS